MISPKDVLHDIAKAAGFAKKIPKSAERDLLIRALEVLYNDLELTTNGENVFMGDTSHKYQLSGDVILISFIVTIFLCFGAFIIMSGRIGDVRESIGVLKEKVGWNESEILKFNEERDNYYYKKILEKIGG